MHNHSEFDADAKHTQEDVITVVQTLKLVNDLLKTKIAQLETEQAQLVTEGKDRSGYDEPIANFKTFAGDMEVKSRFPRTKVKLSGRKIGELSTKSLEGNLLNFQAFPS